MSKPKLKPKVLMEMVLEGKTVTIAYKFEDFKVKDTKEQKVLRLVVAAMSEALQNISNKG